MIHDDINKYKRFKKYVDTSKTINYNLYTVSSLVRVCQERCYRKGRGRQALFTELPPLSLKRIYTITTWLTAQSSASEQTISQKCSVIASATSIVRVDISCIFNRRHTVRLYAKVISEPTMKWEKNGHVTVSPPSPRSRVFKGKTYKHNHSSSPQ